MLSFKEFLLLEKKEELSKDDERALAKHSKLVSAKSGNWYVHPTIHSQARAVQHHPDKDSTDWDKLHKKITDHLDNDSDKNTHVGVYFSKSLNHGYVIKADHVKRRISVHTALPTGKNHNKYEDVRRVIVESVEYDVYYID
jgi:hypothetical protein